METPIRINKYLRDQGIATRREADALIASGKVWVNGTRAKVGMLISPHDDVEVKNVNKKKLVYLAYNKPRGLSTQTEGKSPSVIGEWKKKRLFPVGRLDKESEGLLILTNDGRLTTALIGENSEIEKEYSVLVHEKLRVGLPAIFEKGMKTKTFGTLKPVRAKIKNPHSLHMILREGKRHQIRVMLAELGYTVTSLKRIRIGDILLGHLSYNQTRNLTVQEIESIFGHF